MRTIVIKINVPDDYDAEPIRHRIIENLEALKTGASETDESVEPDMLCPSLTYTFTDAS